MPSCRPRIPCLRPWPGGWGGRRGGVRGRPILRRRRARPPPPDLRFGGGAPRQTRQLAGPLPAFSGWRSPRTKGLQGEAAPPGNPDRRALGTAVRAGGPAPSADLLQVPGPPRARAGPGTKEGGPGRCSGDGGGPAMLRLAAHGQPWRSREPRFASLGHSPRQQSRLRRRRCRCRSGALSHSEPPSSIARL